MMTIDRRMLLQSIGAGSALSLLPTRAVAQAAPANDVAIVRDLLETLHPGLYRYLSPRAYARAITSLERQWLADDRLEARYLTLSRFLASMCCGHSYANFFNQSDAIKAALFDRPTRLPFTFRWIDGAMVVTGNQSGGGGRPMPVALPNGSIIHSINRVPAAEIYRRLRPYARVDGHNEGKARALLAVSGRDSIEFFDVFHGLLFGAPADGLFTIHYRPPGSSRDVWANMPALTLAERRAAMPSARATDADAEQWQWTMRPDGVAILRMDGWALYNSRWNWQAWLDERLDGLGNAKGLVVDIRENEGGLDCGDLILARLTDRPLASMTGRELVRYRAVPERLRPYVDTWDRRFYDWGDAATPVDGGFFLLRRGDGNPVVTPAARRITVPVAILTSAQNSSATLHFVARAKANGLATLIGETSGGNQRGINGGAFFFARLPQSGLEFDIPLIGYFPTMPQRDGGLAPDIAVTPTVNSIASGVDLPLDRAVAHCLTQR